MAIVTKFYGFKKPDYADSADVSVINENMDAIDAKMKEIENKAISGGGGGSSVSYSTEEQVVGTWIDGKPLYQKTIRYDISSTDSTISFPLNLESPDFIMIYDFTLIDGKTSYGHADTYNRYRVVNKSDFEIAFKQSGWASGTTAYVTVRYTMTTD